MQYSLENIGWIFKIDGSLRDLYVQDTSIEDWEILIDYLNIKYELSYNQNERKIDKKYALEYLKDESGEMESKSLTIHLQGITLNCHFFLIDQIEFDLYPPEIKTSGDINNVIAFMEDVSLLLKKSMTLTGENEITFPLIKVDYKANRTFIVDQEIVRRKIETNPLLEKFKILKMKFLLKFFPKYLINKISSSAMESIKPTPKDRNVW